MNNYGYSSLYSVQKNGDTIVAQFVAEVILPDKLKTSEVWEAIKILKLVAISLKFIAH